MLYVCLRTHGGLGNQLFQILFARLIAEKLNCQLREVHDNGYKHAFPRSTLLAISPPPNRLQSCVSSARLPKIAKRYLNRSEAPICLGRTIYLDSYFQDANTYRQFEDQMISRHLERLADEMLRKDEEAQKLKQMGKNIDPNKFKDLF
jgi:hypothetical protein